VFIYNTSEKYSTWGKKNSFRKFYKKKTPHVKGAAYKNNMQNSAQASSNLFSARQK